MATTIPSKPTPLTCDVTGCGVPSEPSAAKDVDDVAGCVVPSEPSDAKVVDGVAGCVVPSEPSDAKVVDGLAPVHSPKGSEAKFMNQQS